MSYQNIGELTGDKEGMRNGEKKRKRRVRCHKCHEPCTGEVLRVQDRHFHINCFYCSVCNHRLYSGGFYVRGEDYYCTADYQNLYGTKCFICHKYVEGEVVTALNNTYHKECFSCDTCKLTFSPGSTVTYDGRSYLCQSCLDLNRSHPGYNHTASDTDTLPPAISQNNYESRNSHFVTPYDGPSRKQDEKRVKCYKCHQYINHSTLVVAMGKLWHQWCFTCLVCQRMMTGKFVARGDDIYCEKHYFDTFGIRCFSCHKYITGKVLMADKACYHYECAVCAYCNQSFNNDQDLYKESDGDRLWHQDCGLESRQKLFSSTDESSYISPMSPEYSETSAFQRDITTPTPQREGVTLSFTTEKQSPPKWNHVRDSSFDSSEMRSRHSSLYSQSTQLSSSSPYANDKAPDLHTTTSESQLNNSLERKNRNNSSSATSILYNSTNKYNKPRQRTTSDTYSIYLAAGNSKIIKKTKEPLNDTRPLSDKENSPAIHRRQNSDISITSTVTEKQHSPIAPSSKRNMLNASDTSTILRTLKKTQECFETSVTEPEEHKPSPIHEEKSDHMSPFNSSSSRSSISSPHLEHSTSDTSSPLSDPIPRKKHQHSLHTYSSTAKAKNNLRVKSAVYNTESSIYNPVVYPLERLLVTAGEYQVFPKGVDRYRLEQHLSVEDFEKIFGMSKNGFSNLPPWKQSDLKKKAKLF